MPIFSRTKSRAKKAAERETSKAEVEENSATLDDAPQRGRKGKEAVRPSQYNHSSAAPPTPGPFQPSQSLNNTSNGSSSAHTRSDSFEGSDYLTALNSEQEHSYAHSSSDSGYSSAGQQSRSISRSPTVQREMGCFQISNKSTTQPTLGEDIAREPSFSGRRPSLQEDSMQRSSLILPKTAESRFLNTSRSLQGMRSYFRPDHGVDTSPILPNPTRYQDARYQRQIQHSMPSRPTSVPPQALRSKSERFSRQPSQCSSSSSGAVLQSSRSAYALRSLAAVPSSSRLPYDWSNQIPSNLDQQLKATPLQPQSPTSPTSPVTPARPESRQSDYMPPLSILDGLKVNRRGLILDEEGDPIGELYDGNIVNCVREKADAHGAVLDEHGRVVGRVRTLLRTDEEPMLRWKASNGEQLHGFPLPPVSATSLAAKSPGLGDARYIAPDQPAQMRNIGIAQKTSLSSLNRTKSSLKRRESVERGAESKTVPRDSSRSPDVFPQVQDLKHFLDQQEYAAPRPLPHACSDILAPVPESHSTAEAEVSDDGSSSSKESQQKPENDVISNRKRARASSSARTDPPRRHTMSSHGRSVSEPIHLTTAAPPVPPKAKRPLKPNQARLFPTDVTMTSTHPRRASFTTTPGRVQSLPPPAFPGRGLASGLPENTLSAARPIPGMPAARRLPTPALPTPSPLGMSNLNTQLPVLRPRASGTIPLVRSPLSSQGKNSLEMGACECNTARNHTDMAFDVDNSPPDLEHVGAVDDFKAASPQGKGHSRSQSMRMLKTRASAMSIGKQRNIFAHTSAAAADKEADVAVKHVGDGVESEKKGKRKNIMGLFGWKN
jgi:hypothetical protein